MCSFRSIKICRYNCNSDTNVSSKRYHKNCAKSINKGKERKNDTYTQKADYYICSHHCRYRTWQIGSTRIYEPFIGRHFVWRQHIVMKEKKIDEKPKKGRMIMWAFIYSGVFIAALIIGVVSKFVQPSWSGAILSAQFIRILHTERRTLTNSTSMSRQIIRKKTTDWWFISTQADLLLVINPETNKFSNGCVQKAI